LKRQPELPEVSMAKKKVFLASALGGDLIKLCWRKFTCSLLKLDLFLPMQQNRLFIK
jgi:hypothetical protein